jgi:hypothetical protein
MCAGLRLNQVHRLLLLPTRLGFLSGLQAGYKVSRHQWLEFAKVRRCIRFKNYVTHTGLGGLATKQADHAAIALQTRLLARLGWMSVQSKGHVVLFSNPSRRPSVRIPFETVVLSHWRAPPWLSGGSLPIPEKLHLLVVRGKWECNLKMFMKCSRSKSGIFPCWIDGRRILLVIILAGSVSSHSDTEIQYVPDGNFDIL